MPWAEGDGREREKRQRGAVNATTASRERCRGRERLLAGGRASTVRLTVLSGNPSAEVSGGGSRRG